MTWTTRRADQLDWHWRNALRPRLEGLTDEEYFWEPVAECWTVHSDGAIDFAYPPPQPEPFTTIAWRLAHVIVGVFAMRSHNHFGGPPAAYQSWRYAQDADTALTQLDEEYYRWITGVQALTDEGLGRPCGPAEGPYAEYPLAELVLHINREVIHHGAEIACIRDLYVHRTPERTLMPALAPPVRDERHALHEFLDYQQSAFVAVAHGLTDEQARATPTVSALSIGGLIKHVTGMQRLWMQRVAAAPAEPPADTRPFEERRKEYEDEYVMRPDETLAQVLDAYAVQNAETLRNVQTADFDAAVPVPRDAPWFPKDVDAWSVRWVFLHVISELARHAGHADIIRESIDGATMYELVAAAENWEPQPWLTPWTPK